VIEAHKDEKKEEKKGSYCRCERYQGNYRRVLSLNDEVNSEKIAAFYDNGVLKLEVPKKEPAPSKEIKIG